MKAKTFRLSDTSIEQLEAIVEAKDISQADAIRFAIQQGYDAIQVQDNSHTADETDSSSWKIMYLAEKQRSDDLTNKLLTLTDKVADSLHAAQTLQAMDKPALESTAQKEERKTRWQRLKEAWRG